MSFFQEIMNTNFRITPEIRANFQATKVQASLKIYDLYFKAFSEKYPEMPIFNVAQLALQMMTVGELKAELENVWDAVKCIDLKC
jgi:hypothetical protein